MKEEIARIMRLVQEGKLSPEDAAELIDAFQSAEPQEEERQAAPPPPPPGGFGDTPPPPPPGAAAKDPFRSFVDTMEGIGKEVSQSVNWQEVARQVREGTKKGLQEMRDGLESLKQGKVNFGWFSAYETRDVNLPLNSTANKTLRIENQCGDVKVTGGFSEFSVSARARVRGTDPQDALEKANAYTVIVEESDHEILVRQPDVSGLEVDLVVQIDSAQHLEIRTPYGDIRVADTAGSCRVNNQSGDIDLKGLNGIIEVSTQNGDLSIDDCSTPALNVENKTGDISVRRVAGNMNVRASSGDINISDCAGKSVSVESVNGDVKVSLNDPVTATVNVRTVNGDARVEVPQESNCRVSLSTLRGDVSCDATLADEAKMEQRITGRLGEGSGALDVSAVNGDVSFATRVSSEV